MLLVFLLFSCIALSSPSPLITPGERCFVEQVSCKQHEMERCGALDLWRIYLRNSIQSCPFYICPNGNMVVDKMVCNNGSQLNNDFGQLATADGRKWITDAAADTLIRAMVRHRRAALTTPEHYYVSYHVQILNYNAATVCGAAILNHCFAVTAAHCVVDQPDLDRLWFHVKAYSDRRESGIQYEITKAIIHPNYRRNGTPQEKLGYDIALIFLNNESGFLIHKSHLPLASRPERIGEVGNMSGFGEEYNNLNVYPRDNIMNLPKKRLTVLDKPLKGVPTVFTTSGWVGQGDGGSPFVWEENGQTVLGGIRTENLELGDLRPRFVRIFDFKDWINKQIEKTLREYKLELEDPSERRRLMKKKTDSVNYEIII